MKSNLKIYTSYVSPDNLKSVIEANYLPIFILRNISNSTLIGKWSGTAVHFKQLSPSNELYQAMRDNKITTKTYHEKYKKEISGVNLKELIEKLEFLASVCNGKGVVLMSYGWNYEKCHRSALSDILNNSNLLINKVTEIL